MAPLPTNQYPSTESLIASFQAGALPVQDRPNKVGAQARKRTSTPTPLSNKAVDDASLIKVPPALLTQTTTEQPQGLVGSVVSKGAAAKAAPARRTVPSKRAYIYKWACNRRFFSQLPICGLILLAIWLPGAAVAVIRTLTAVARTAEEVGGAAGQVITKGATLTSVVFDVTTDLFLSSASAVEEAWKGIDLYDVKISRTDGNIKADDLTQLYDWLGSEDGVRLVQWPGSVYGQVGPVFRAVSHSRPYVDLSHHTFVTNSSYLEFHVRVQLLSDGWYLMYWSFVLVNYTPVWANPAWELLRLPYSSQQDRLQQRLASAVVKVGASPIAGLPLGANSTVVVFNAVWYRAWLWASGLCWGLIAPALVPPFCSSLDGCGWWLLVLLCAVLAWLAAKYAPDA